MRDEDRIDVVVEMLRKAWKRSPDMRLGQLLIVVGGISNGDTSGMFNREDDRWLESLQRFAEPQSVERIGTGPSGVPIFKAKVHT